MLELHLILKREKNCLLINFKWFSIIDKKNVLPKPQNDVIFIFISQLIPHDDFFNRIQKSLYYGSNKAKISIPLSDYIADTFSDTHNGYSLNRLNYKTVGNLRSTPCSLILAMIYLERLKDADPAYTKHVTPTELFLVSMVSSL